MTGCTVKAMSRSGARGRRTRLRSEITSVSETTRLMPPSPPRPRAPAPRGPGRLAGQREEPVVQRGPPQPEVVPRAAGLVEPAHSLDDRARALRDREPDGLPVRHWRLVGPRGGGAPRARRPAGA